MTHVPHELAEEFPDAHEAIHDLKMTDAHFARLADAYHALNREVHRIEAGIETPSDFYVEDLKKRRLALKDEIAGMIAATG